MTTLEMECILRLSETLNFSKAALEMNITQPAFSRLISRAENELGFKLFVRNTRAVEISREGMEFIITLRKAYAMLKEGAERSRKLLREGNLLNVVCSAEFICLKLASHVAAFREKYPEVTAEVIPTSTENVPALLRCKKADIGFIFVDQEKFNTDFETELIRKVPLHLLVNEKNPLARKAVLQPTDLIGEKIVVLQTNAGAYEVGSYGAPLFMLNRKTGLHLKDSDTEETTQSCLIRVACNQNVFFVPSTVDFPTPSNCVLKEIEGIDFNFIAIWNKKELSKWGKRFLEQVRAGSPDWGEL